MAEPSRAHDEHPASQPLAAVDPARPLSLLGRVKAFRHRYEKWEMISFFAGGFIFDAYMLRRIDDAPMLLQQGAYLLVVGALLVLGHFLEAREIELKGVLAKVWRVADPLAHFMLGTLLNGFMIFYMKAASGPAAVLFFVLIAASLAINEMPFFHRFGRVVLLGLYSFCITSYFAYLIPVLLGHIRSWMFYAAVAATLGVLIAVGKLYARWQPEGGWRQVLIPGVSVQALLTLLFVLRMIPPVPLAIGALGIYHDVHRTPDGGWALVHEAHPWWKFWVRDDSTFVARAGDKVYAFVRVLAPHTFQDRILVRWSRYDPQRGWISDAPFPLTITGKREEGFRTRASKARYTPGLWKVAIETEDGRTIDDMTFTIAQSDATDATQPRTFVNDEG